MPIGRPKSTSQTHRTAWGYDLTRCLKHRSRYVLLIRWDSVEGHLKEFRGSPAFQHFMALVAPFFKQIEEMEHYEKTGIELAK